MMADDPIRAYQDALRAMEEAEGRAERVVRYITDVADWLGDWRDVRVADGKTSFPVGVGQKQSIIPDRWPTVQQLAEVLAAWHQAAHVARNAWAAIPMPDKKGLKGPGL